MLDMPRTVPRLFFQFPGSRIRRFLVYIHQTASQLPSPAIGHEPMTPEHQHPNVFCRSRRIWLLMSGWV